MKLFNYYRQDTGEVGLGAVTEEGHVLVTETAEKSGLEAPCCIEAAMKEDGFAELLAGILSDSAKAVTDEDSIDFASPLLHPEKIICVGLNYRKHAEETHMPIPKVPIYFAKYSNALNCHKGEIPLRPVSVQYDYEAELTVVIGKECSEVSEEEALDYVFGYTCGNDFSCRDLQVVTSQWTISKTMDGFAPIGPYVVTGDAIDAGNLRIAAWVNGEKRQDSNTNDLIFDVKCLISDLSRRLTLKPGDIIMTGTPSGVIMAYPPEERVWLKKGDVVDIEIEGIGKLTNVLA
ncbi:MAG: fumarylacetoacetate hydrolase family protein [Clostridiales Family XIII bacterium]|jgi:2-keto-4-pentenoate hydratase/2-oxohepta-3-ene-1,7-dioic acid hydratase in catechol pathway|nr:fumarylacetoacetate hydrolase family protein [Clostridiales Family XIII bacterium]